ncbi:glycosyltransferase [Pontibacter sp. CAU 1760]
MKQKSKILISIDWYLPGYKAGGPIQSIANFVAHLQGAYDFWIVTRDTDYNTVKPYSDVPSDVWHQRDDSVHVYYFSAANLSYTSLKRVITQVPADFLYINGIFSKYFSLMPLFIAKKLQVPVVIAARGMFAPGAVNVKPNKKKVFFYLAKKFALYNAVKFHATNETELRHIQKILGKQTQVLIAANLPKIGKHPFALPVHKQKGEIRLVSVARVSPEKNTLYALGVLRDTALSGNIVFDLYGPINDAAYWQDCLSVIEQMPDNIKVTYKGSLPSELVPQTLLNYHMLFLPTKGENFGHIILESFTVGLPVIISNQTPWKDLQDRKVGYDLPLRDPDVFANAIQQMINVEQSDYQILSQHATQFAVEFIANKENISANKALFEC